MPAIGPDLRAEAPTTEDTRMTAPLKIGDPAPAFDLAKTGGGSCSLQTLGGRKAVLYFYPKDDTSGCTEEEVDEGGLVGDDPKARARIARDRRSVGELGDVGGGEGGVDRREGTPVGEREERDRIQRPPGPVRGGRHRRGGCVTRPDQEP